MMFLDYDQGGLRAPSIYVLSKSLRLAWISRLLADEHKNGESWKSTSNYIFRKIRGPKFHVTVQSRQEISRSDWATSVLQIDSPVLLGILFKNKDILIHGHSIFYRNWFDCGIYLVYHLLKADWKFLSYSEFIQKYNLRCNSSSIFK